MSLLPELGSWLDVQTDHLHRENRGKKSRQIFCLLKDLSRQKINNGHRHQVLLCKQFRQ